MNSLLRRSGTTLLELAVLLGLLGLLLGVAAPLGRVFVHRGAVVSAREQVLGLVHRARALALAGGGATLRVRQDDELILLLDGAGSERERLDMAEAGVDLRTTGSAREVDLTWNALGWGRVSSRTLDFRRGSARARLVISSRGRASRR